MGYYFLGYAYLNMGLYLKARLTWQDFLRLSAGSETEIHEMDDQLLASLREEISERVEELEEPVQIELGCNSIMGGDFVGGKDTLMKFAEGRYSQWWPLWYYLGVAEASLGNADEAIADFKKVLTLSPSNTDAMDELVHLYEATGDKENAAKYRNKIGIVNSNREEENGAI
jgi:tetratricopeptide (TPR) repeat protein